MSGIRDLPGNGWPKGQEKYLAINAELATQWQVIASRIPAMEGADLWDGIPDKLPLLDRGKDSR